MGPTSVVWVAGPLLLGLLLITVTRRRRWLLIRLVAAALSLALGMGAGVALVNDYYGYYRSWSAVAADFGSGPNYVVTAGRDQAGPALHGTLRTVTIGGSHLSRKALVYLPPQYPLAADAGIRFPVLELLHGSPGQPLDWVTGLHVETLMDTLISRHQIGPMVLVMPSVNSSHDYEDCVNGPLAQDETYIADDVPAYLRAHFRVAADPAQLGLAGFSSGGYCAANLALRQPGRFGAAAIMDGYFRAQDGPAGSALGHRPGALTANSPLTTAALLRPGVSPLPAFWVMSGTGSAGDYRAARAFVDVLDRVTQVPFLVDDGAGHNYPTWAAALPAALCWLWRTVAPPDLHTRFPVVAPPRSVLRSGALA